MLFLMVGLPASHMPMPPPLSSMRFASSVGEPVNENCTALPAQPTIVFERMMGEPDPQLMPLSQFTIALDIIVGEPPTEMPSELSMSVNPASRVSGVEPEKLTATEPVAEM